MQPLTIPRDTEAEEWWRSHRIPYNIGFIGSTLVAMCTQVIVSFVCPAEDAEITLVTIIFGIPTFLLGYGIIIICANLCYTLGLRVEQISRPTNPARYRRWAFASGLFFSIALPFGLPLVTVLTCHQPHNEGMNLTARTVTRLAGSPSNGGLERERARRAPVRSAGYARR